MLTSNLSSNLTSEAIEAVLRLPWPQRPPKWPLEATCNMHIDTRINEVADFKSEVKFEF